jgi:tryptophan 2,3-dioxygenase
MLTAVETHDPIHDLITRWLSSYVTRPHPDLGRRGPICPYVAQALTNNNVAFAAYHFGAESSLEKMNIAIGEGVERFRDLQTEIGDSELLSLILAFPDLAREHWHLIDDAHRASKTKVVQEGLMLGQFHPLCDSPAAHNRTFPVNRAPVPLMVIRQMAPHDILFLESDPRWVEHYKVTLARRGIEVDHLAYRRSSAGAQTGGAVQETCSGVAQADEAATDAPYVRYACTDRLQEMQFPKSGSPLELSFILITQVKELLFRMLYVEIDRARTHIRAGEVIEVCQALARANRVQRVLLTSWDLLTGMSVTDYAGFREVLGEASGRQSFMYRALELIMGNHDPDSIEHLREYGPLHHILDYEVDSPSFYDEVIAYLHRTVQPMSDAVLQRDLARQYLASPDVEAAWLAIYREPSRFPTEYSLAEALTELSFQFSQWRATHLLVVERMIGAKRGTGETEGVEWLRRISEHRFFPELWSVRTTL